jgi:hypothetical protein
MPYILFKEFYGAQSIHRLMCFDDKEMNLLIVE